MFTFIHADFKQGITHAPVPLLKDFTLTTYGKQNLILAIVQHQLEDAYEKRRILGGWGPVESGKIGVVLRGEWMNKEDSSWSGDRGIPR